MKSALKKSVVWLAVVTLTLGLGRLGSAGPDSIYGIHFYGNCGGVGAESIMNGKPGYDVELVYVQNLTDWSGIRSQVQTAKNAGFTPIVRLDWVSGQTVPASGDWTGRYSFAQQCKAAAQNLGDLCNIWVIGNEMNLSAEGAIPADWYLDCYSNYDSNNCYTQIHSVQSSAIVCMGAVGPDNPDTNAAGPYDNTYETWKNYCYYLVHNASATDGFAVHAYGGRYGGQPGLADYDPDPRDDSNYPSTRPSLTVDMDWGFNQLQYFMGEIDSRFQNSQVYVTETNTYLDAVPSTSYRAGWIPDAFEAVDTWNQTHYHRINALCWFVYSYGYGWGDFALMTECRSNPPANLVQARADFSSATANHSYVNTFENPDAYVYQVNAGASNPYVDDPNQIVMGNYVGSVNNWIGANTNWGSGGPLGQSTYWMMLQSRIFYAPTSGTYNFQTTSDDGSWLWVDAQVVVDNWGLHPPQTATGSKYLTAGYHWVYVKFYQWQGGSYTGYQYQPPGGGWQTIAESRPPKGNCLIYNLDTTNSNVNSSDLNQIVPSSYVDAMAYTGVARDWSSGGPDGLTNYWLMMKPFLFYVAAPGTYQFRTGSDDGSWLWIDGQIVVNNYGLHPIQWAGGSKYLGTGWHTGFFKMFQNTGGAYSAFDYIPPSGPGWDVMFTY